MVAALYTDTLIRDWFLSRHSWFVLDYLHVHAANSNNRRYPTSESRMMMCVQGWPNAAPATNLAALYWPVSRIYAYALRTHARAVQSSCKVYIPFTRQHICMHRLPKKCDGPNWPPACYTPIIVAPTPAILGHPWCVCACYQQWWSPANYYDSWGQLELAVCVLTVISGTIESSANSLLSVSTPIPLSHPA